MAFNITDFNNKWANFKEELKDYFNKRVVDKNGDTMIGGLRLSKEPESDLDAVNKQFVEKEIESAFTLKPGTLQATSLTIPQPSRNRTSITLNEKMTEEITLPYICASGNVKCRIRISPLYGVATLNGSFLTESGDYYYHYVFRNDNSSTSNRVDCNINFSIRMYIVPDDKSEYLFYELSEATNIDCLKDGSMSVHTFDLESIPIQAGVNPKIRIETIIHSCSPTGRYAQGLRNQPDVIYLDYRHGSGKVYLGASNSGYTIGVGAGGVFDAE